jgi:protein TonB
MIARSLAVKLAALVAATGVHAALIVGLAGGPEPVRTQGAGVPVEARLGTSFRDLVAGGVVLPERPERTEALTPDRPLPARTGAEAEAARAALPDRAEALQHAEAPAALSASRPERLSATRPETALRPDPDPSPEAIPARPAATPAERPDPAPEPDPAQLAHRVPDTALAAQTEVSGAPGRSLRPSTRPAGVERAPAPVAEAPPRDTPRQAPSAPGNAARNATAGTAVGRTDAPVADTGAGRQQAASGNAAASSYPGQVMRCISRAGRPRVEARGTAVVSFRISGSGRVTDAALAATSGDAGLDRAALRTISGAGPCPAPPPGARTSFSIRVEGR